MVCQSSLALLGWGCEIAETKRTARKPWEIEDGLWARIGPLPADRSYDHDKYRRQVRHLGITPVIARRGTDHGSGLGAYRWVAEAAFALLHWFRRLRIPWEIRDDIHEAFLTLGCAIICWRRLRQARSPDRGAACTHRSVLRLGFDAAPPHIGPVVVPDTAARSTGSRSQTRSSCSCCARRPSPPRRSTR